MHGELMEFNELLQKQLLNRELQLKCLTEELVSLRGPVSPQLIEFIAKCSRIVFLIPLLR